MQPFAIIWAIVWAALPYCRASIRRSQAATRLAAFCLCWATHAATLAAGEPTLYRFATADGDLVLPSEAQGFGTRLDGDTEWRPIPLPSV